MTSEQIDSHSALFHASFADGKNEAVVLTDNGSDVNLISPKLFNILKNEDKECTFRKLNPPHYYKGVGEDSLVTCTDIIKTSVLLKIWHANHLLLRNVELLVAKENTEHAIIGRPLLESIGCDNKTLLAATADKFGGIIDAPEVVSNNEDENKGTIAPLLDEGIFHSAGGSEADGLDEEDIYIDLGEVSDAKIIKELDKRIEETRVAGMSEQGQKELKNLLNENIEIFG